MSKLLTPEAIAQFRRDGFFFPVRAMPASAARHYRDLLEAQERSDGGPLQSNRRHKVHLLFRWANELVRNPTILDAVEDLIGPNILCWSTNFFIKEAKDPAFVSWHQDATYWGLEPDEIVTAWLAFRLFVQHGEMVTRMEDVRVGEQNVVGLHGRCLFETF